MTDIVEREPSMNYPLSYRGIKFIIESLGSPEELLGLKLYKVLFDFANIPIALFVIDLPKGASTFVWRQEVIAKAKQTIDRSGFFEEEANDGHDGEETHEAMEREQAQIVVDRHGQLYKLHEDGKYQTLTVDKGNRHTLATLQLYFGPLTLPDGSPL